MDDYIRRGEALSEACKGCSIDFPCEPCEPQDCEIKARLQAIPAADVVEVVRCRECVYWEPASPTRISGNCNRSFEISSWAHDFCSYGERKDGGTDE